MERYSTRTVNGTRAHLRRHQKMCHDNVVEIKQLLLRGSSLGRGVGVLLSESLDAPGGVDKLLFAGEKGMTTRANFHPQRVAFYGRTRRESVPAGAMHGNSVIVGMNSGFHGSPIHRVRSARHCRILPRR
jgi:hypothetical protein